MSVSGGDARERLINLWSSWGLVPDTAGSKAQHEACDVVAAWLERCETEPDIVIRAVQVLLAEPERPDRNTRPSWSVFRKVLTEAWPNAGTGPSDLFYAQALLLAMWPAGTGNGWMTLTSLLDTAWDVMPGRERQRPDLDRWRSAQYSGRSTGTQGEPVEPPSALPHLAPYGGVKLKSADALQHVTQHQADPQFSVVGPKVVQLFGDHVSAIENLGIALTTLSNEVNGYGSALAAQVTSRIERELASAQNAARRAQGELDILWWGQARFSQALRKPYRRISEPDDLLWWLAWEAAALSRSLEVEPAAAYLVETLHGLEQDVFETRPLRTWMEGLHAALVRAGDKAPKLSNRLKPIAAEDALGLPVTWVRLQTAQKESFSAIAAADAVALDLDATIDRGAWTSWVFRESLLDLRLNSGI